MTAEFDWGYAPLHVWMAPAWQEKMQRAAQKSLAVMCPACSRSPDGLLARDCVYGAAVTHRLRAMGIRDKPIAPGSPWQNGFAERLIGSIRRECVDHLVFFGEATITS
jgi:hypothetical protein